MANKRRAGPFAHLSPDLKGLAQMTTWEYMTVQLTRHYPDTLDAYGRNGWELVAVFDDGVIVAVFKRPLPFGGQGQ